MVRVVPASFSPTAVVNLSLPGCQHLGEREMFSYVLLKFLSAVGHSYLGSVLILPLSPHVPRAEL